MTPLQIGQALRIIRESRGLRGDQVKGVNKWRVSKIETGKEGPTLTTLLRYLAGCDSDFSELADVLERLR